MNAKVISASLAGLVLLVGAFLITRDPNVQGAPQLQGSNASSTVQTRDRGLDNSVIADAELFERVAQLEQTVGRDWVREMQDLVSRVEDLERAARNQQGNRSASNRSPSNEIAQLKRDNASLRRAHDALASKVATSRTQQIPSTSDLRVLQQRVYSLENKVRLIENRR